MPLLSEPRVPAIDDGTGDPATLVDRLADRLNALTVPAAAARLAELGEAESGAFNFYAVRIARANLFGDYEKALAAEMMRQGLPRAVHEIGGGFGTLSWLFAGLGVETVCLEHDRRRVAAAQALWVALAMGDPALAGRLEICPDRFPSATLRPGRATAIATNIVFTTTPEQRAGIVAALARYGTAIIDLDRFLVSAGPEARPGTIAEFAAAGMEGEPFLDLGSAACFWRFQRR